MWKTLEFLYFNHFALANDVSQKSLHFELHSNNFLLALKLISGHSKWLAVTVKTLLATRQHTSWNVLNSYGSGRCAFNFKINDDFWSKWKSLFDIYDTYLTDDPDFITLYRKENFEILTNFTRTQFWEELAKSQFQLVQNTVNELYKIFWLVGHLVIKAQFAARSGLGCFELPTK